VHAYTHDWLGGTANLLSPTGVPVAGYDYDPFGNPRVGPSLAGQQLPEASVENPMRFAGAYQDSTSGDGNYYLRARNYDPGTGRFASRDAMPTGQGAVSAYRYAAEKAAAAKAAAERAAKRAAAEAQAKAKALAAKAKAKTKKDAGDGAACPIAHSFVAGTAVLLADGTTKPIEEVEPGDTVAAGDPSASLDGADKQVTHTIRTDDDREFVDVTVAGSGEKLTTTEHHPFWSETRKKWVEAGDLREGELLRTSAGTYVQVSAVRSYQHKEVTYDLTVDDLHTYYVLAGAEAVLVHNCDMDNHVRASKNAAYSKDPQNATGGVLHIEGHGSFDLNSSALHPDVKDDILKSGVGRMDDGSYYGSHVEVQAAFLLQKYGGEGAVGRLMITHPAGMCGFCRGNVRDLLPAAAALTVRFGRNGKFYQAGRYFGS